jgi:hypothetical protein
MCSENVHWCAQNAENGFGFDIYRAIPQRWRISQSHHTRNKWWNLGFICEQRNQRAVKTVKAVDAHTSTKQAEKVLTTLSARELMATVF